jgi:NAD(P)-dependent dehydrogenase (short-subunit alcohol dehydrogenase family)
MDVSMRKLRYFAVLADERNFTRAAARLFVAQQSLSRQIRDNGSFTLVSGVVGDEVTPASTVGATVNRMVEGFVKAAATELPRGVRINCVSPTVLTESVAYHDFFPGFTPVPAAEVAQA